MKLAYVLGNARKMDLYRIAKDENVPRRGRKKHFSQMTKEEIEYLFNKLKSVKKWSISFHALNRLKEKGIEATYKDIVSTIHNSILIEYHVTKSKLEGKDERVLLRSKALVNGDNNLHVVYSITTRKIVSVWLNHKDDFHKTIDMRDYDKKLKILGA